MSSSPKIRCGNSKSLADIAFQTERYHDLLADLEPALSWMRPTIQGILASLGCVAKVVRRDDNSLDVQVTLHIGQAALPWLSETEVAFDTVTGELD